MINMENNYNMKTLKEVIKAYRLCEEMNCKECPYYKIPECHEDNFCLSKQKDSDTVYYLEAYEDAFRAFDKLEEDLKAEKEKYNEAIQYCNKMEKKYKNMINNFIQENKQ